ncbi:MAG: ATP-binding protein, partial [Thermoplasmatota archaeon]
MAGNRNGRSDDMQGEYLHRIMIDRREGIIVDSPLRPLIDEKSGYIVLGRSTSAHKKWRRKGLLQIGAVGELKEDHEDLFGREVFIDAAFPHIIFICGKRGSGKSYTLGIFAEELVRSAIGVGVVLVDPIGIFWSLKMENTSRSEKKAMDRWGLSPTSFPEVKVLAPGTDISMLPTNCDGPFTIGIGEMTVEDWCQVFDMDRFKTQGLLVGTAIDQVRSGYKAIIDDVPVDIPPRPDRFSIGDIIQCMETSAHITSRTGGYNPQTRRSVIARFTAAAGWGIFSVEGTPLRELTSPNRVTVLDVSDTNLGDSKRSLITGIVARKILEGRIQTARIEEHHGIDETDPDMIPLTWLLIDEAHIILPHNRQTPASQALIEYAKQGRKPGCAMILATQRPASTSDEILSQVDILLGHNLALEDDMSALRRRVPAKLPQDFAVSDFIRGIPVGTAIVADQKTQQRSFLV